MFRYGKKCGYMSIALIVLGVAPLVATLICMPQMADTVATRFSSTGEVTRWASKYELFLVPALCALLSLATFLSARRQAALVDDSAAIAALTCERYLRNGLVSAVVLAVAGFYLLYAAMTGTGLPI